MECSYCTDADGNPLQMIRDDWHVANYKRIDKILVQSGIWECPNCNVHKPIYQKRLATDEPDAYYVKCFCCRDTGKLDDYDIQRYLLEDYNQSDPPVICRRCESATEKQLPIEGCWDIADKALCDRVHAQHRQRFLAAQPSETNFQQNIQSLVNKMGMKPAKPATEEMVRKL